MATARESRATVASAPSIAPPSSPVKLIFIHHSTGQAWLADDYGGLGVALRSNNYYVSDTNYGWGPNVPGSDPIGSYTDIGQWWLWFRSPNSPAYLSALYGEYGQHSDYSRLSTAPVGDNQIIMLKSCFPNSALKGTPSDLVPPIESNPLRGEGAGSEYHTVANAKGIYIDLLEYFRTRPDKLFIIITAPPLSDSGDAANARAFNQWLVTDWLNGYPYKNVYVFDYYNVLTTNGGSPSVNDLNSETGNHHRWWNNAVQHTFDGMHSTLAYPTDDDHPSTAGDVKATNEFLPLLNEAYNEWSLTPPRPTPWQSLGGYLTSSPAATSSTSGAVDVFVRGGDNGLWWKHWNGQDWSAWTPLGGYLTGDPAATSQANGVIDVFVRGGNGALYQREYNGGWQSWTSLGGVLAPGTGPAACSWGSGRLDVFVEGMTGALYHQGYHGTWDGWESLGGVLTASPAAASPASGVIDVFVRGSTGALWQREYNDTTDGALGPLSAECSLPEQGQRPARAAQVVSTSLSKVRPAPYGIDRMMVRGPTGNPSAGT